MKWVLFVVFMFDWVNLKFLDGFFIFDDFLFVGDWNYYDLL